MTANSSIVAGPCALDDAEINMKVATHLKELGDLLGFEYVFKASFDKANRLSIQSKRGLGLSSAKPLFMQIRDSLKIQTTTDVHEISQIDLVAEFVDIIQIPAFLARQTDLIVEAAKTGRIVNIKKAQFMSWQDVILAAEKARSAGAKEVWVTERGTMFGYRDLIVDFRNLYEILQTNIKLIFDATHSVQRPGGALTSSAGDRKYVPTLVACAAAAGVQNLFFETHPNPDASISDGMNMIPLSYARTILEDFMSLRDYRADNSLSDID